MQPAQSSLNYKHLPTQTPDPLEHVIAIANNGRIHLSSTTKQSKFRVIYGLQSTDHRSFDQAMNDFNNCLRHCKACGDL